jgi:hypothetical protein
MVQFKGFFNIFNQLKDFLMEESAKGEVQNLYNNYRLFVYERPLPQGRGLPAIDDDGKPIPIPEPTYVFDSSD